jgi:hypothetical protein
MVPSPTHNALASCPAPGHRHTETCLGLLNPFKVVCVRLTQIDHIVSHNQKVEVYWWWLHGAGWQDSVIIRWITFMTHDEWTGCVGVSIPIMVTEMFHVVKWILHFGFNSLPKYG